MIFIAAGLLAALVAAGWLIDRTLTRHAAERSDWATERAWLLQRIQAPTVAVAQFDPTSEPIEEPAEPTEEEMRVFHNEQDEILHALGRLVEDPRG